ncbi:hypothetical protein COCCADRAFT_25153 [Bipolaris zeicola 26-R-13]|uniref:Uncharacterized protein n=1 Tax=Cochliobolus carbonum (strain 26-R-13) TaxID=930089 RepID=W6YTG9_COCC2|nr:uncharacterized protein COCCADRAFT_25153 [Bipolaris zeicola 26-R-13]EUC34806.1 hypothetical protein COCCADRAFT_25153 [Bipolaris zeicola 26-R-13]
MSSVSTERILNSFPMFGHTGWNALQYAGTFYDTRNRTSTTSGSFESISTSSMFDENTPPTTADTQPASLDLSPPIVFKHEVKTQKRGKGTFLNHTPRSYEMQTPRTMDAYGSLGHSREKYSCHRMFGCAVSVDESTIFASPCGYSSSAESRQGDYKISVLPATPVELDSKEVASPSSREDHLLSVKPIQRSSSLPVARALKYEPRVALPSGYTRYEVGGWSTKPQIDHSPDRKYSGRRVSFKVTAPDSRSASRHASLEHLSTKNRRKASREVIGELPQKEIEQAGNVAVFGVTQEYLDSQVGEPFSTSETFHAYSSDSREMLVPELPKRSISAPVRKQYVSYAAEESDMREALPALLYRGPKSVIPSGFPFHIAPSLPAVGENGSLDHGQDVLSRKIHIRNGEHKARGPKYLDVGKAEQRDHPPVGRLAPPILSHEALTANANLGLNDLSYYLKHTGPSPTESKHPKLRQRKRSIKFFRPKERKKQAPAHGGGSSPERIAKQTPINPAWVRETKTSGGVRHLRIVIPTTENECDMTVKPLPALPVQGQQHTRNVSSNGFEEDTLCPPENSAVQHILYGSSEAAMHSFSEPHMTYHEQARAHKLRDSQHVKRKLTPDGYYSRNIRGKYRDSFVDVAACTTDAFHDAIMHAHDDEGFEEEDSVRRTERLEERVMLLQRQNMRLMEALAKIVGVVLEHDDLDCETMMRASLRA